MTTIDQDRSVKDVAERLARTKSSRHRHMLETLKAHLQAERDQSLDGLMATLADHPEYRFWRNGKDGGPKGRDAVKSFYQSLVASRRGVLEYALDRIVVDDDTVVTEGVIRAYQPGRVAQDFGFAVDELDATYLVAYRAVIFWPFDEHGDMLGEEGYTTFDPHDAFRVSQDELPAAYVDQFPASELVGAGLTTT